MDTEIRDNFDAIKQQLTAIETLLKGYGNGEGGLVEQVASNRRRINRLDKTLLGIVIVLALSGTGYGIGIARILGG